ncbi:MAG: hypothetical protein RBG13Loki_1521 [Promethearchaeota archaeon CR_4]|nr:MAG: hypothetical protein RBG13Loki_1521 [Candidatus Lokiarchaeota archaeon CR_4]
MGGGNEVIGQNNSEFIRPRAQGGGIHQVFVEIIDVGVVVFHPGTSEVATEKSTLDEALAFARAEWPDCGIRVVRSVNVGNLCSSVPTSSSLCI